MAGEIRRQSSRAGSTAAGPGSPASVPAEPAFLVPWWARRPYAVVLYAASGAAWVVLAGSAFGLAHGPTDYSRGDGMADAAFIAGTSIVLFAVLRHLEKLLDAANARLTAATRRLARMAEFVLVSPRPVMELSPDGNVTWMNATAENALVAAGADIKELLPPNAPDLISQIAAAHTGSEEIRVSSRGITWDWWLHPRYDPPGALAYVIDRTAEIRSAELLLTAQKVESLRTMAEGVAHDFNNALTSIIGNIGVARRAGVPDGEANEALADAEMVASATAQLVRQLLAYTGSEPRDLAALSVNEVIRDVRHLLCASLRPAVALKLTLQPDLPAILGDSAQLKQMLLALVVNAGEALGEGPGEVCVETASCELTPEQVATPLCPGPFAEGCYVVLTVSDTGPGIPAALLQRVFEPFFSTKFTGRGLGLPATLGIAKGHGGSAKIESQPGVGTVFTVILPAQPGMVLQPTGTGTSPAC